MTFRIEMSSLGLRAVFRCAAMLLLAFTASDLVSHGECDEDWLGIPAAAFRIAASPDRCAAEPVLRAALDLPDSSPEPVADEEDCFCCCSHLLVTPHYVLADCATERLSVAPPRHGPLTAPPPSLDRPPRTL